MAAMIAACSGDSGDSMTIEEYFAELADLETRIEDRADQVEEPFSLDENAPFDERREAYRSFRDEFRNLAADYGDEFAELTPPDEVEAAHETYAAALNEFFDQYDDLLSRFVEAETPDELADFDADDFDAALEAFSEACFDLEEVAASHEIDVDLDCEIG